MKNIVYILEIKERDDYFFNSNTFSCREVNKIKTVKCETVYKENGKILRRNKYNKIYIENNGKEECVDGKNYTSFSSLDDVIAHFNTEYIEVHSTKHNRYFLDTDSLDTVVTIRIAEGNGFGFAKGYIDLDKLIQK